eukprot:Gb_14563 [translate_table: standard]
MRCVTLEDPLIAQFLERCHLKSNKGYCIYNHHSIHKQLTNLVCHQEIQVRIDTSLRNKTIVKRDQARSNITEHRQTETQGQEVETLSKIGASRDLEIYPSTLEHRANGRQARTVEELNSKEPPNIGPYSMTTGQTVRMAEPSGRQEVNGGAQQYSPLSVNQFSRFSEKGEKQLLKKKPCLDLWELRGTNSKSEGVLCLAQSEEGECSLS